MHLCFNDQVAVPIIPYPQFLGEAPNDDPDELNQFAHRVRRGQPVFRKNLLKVYDGKCVVSGCSVEATLNAAHIFAHASSGINNIDNGLLLRSDIHDLFDAGLLGIDPDSLIIRIKPELKETTYWKYDGKVIASRLDGGRPAKKYLLSRQNSSSKSQTCLLYTSPSPRDRQKSRMPSSA
eukprot:TRINITY_DN23439_c0_g1_i1.p1 TRINITY_DN23439_c0_g1~~TRINITY_DN23439_c0_g1_i1.p1  ORF type:complete len:179 (+),score=13.61 TRINITY_DN23439_c0_g1_i1:3-539(+)